MTSGIYPLKGGQLSSKPSAGARRRGALAPQTSSNKKIFKNAFCHFLSILSHSAPVGTVTDPAPGSRSLRCCVPPWSGPPGRRSLRWCGSPVVGDSPPPVPPTPPHCLCFWSLTELSWEGKTSLEMENLRVENNPVE